MLFFKLNFLIINNFLDQFRIYFRKGHVLNFKNISFSIFSVANSISYTASKTGVSFMPFWPLKGYTNFSKSFQSIMSIIRRVNSDDGAFDRQSKGPGLDTQRSGSVPFSTEKIIQITYNSDCCQSYKTCSIVYCTIYRGRTRTQTQNHGKKRVSRAYYTLFSTRKINQRN